MKAETLQRANELHGQIMLLKNRLSILMNVKKKEDLRLVLVSKYKDIVFSDSAEMDFTGEFIIFYISKLEAKIKQLETEFENLKD